MSRCLVRWSPKLLALTSFSLRSPAPAHSFSHPVHQPKKNIWFFNPPSLPLPVIWLRFDSYPLRTLEPFLGSPRLSQWLPPEVLITLHSCFFYPGLIEIWCE